MKALELSSFPEIAERISALYNEEQDSLLLGMLGQEYIIRRDGVLLHGQKAPAAHAAVVMDYLFSPGTTPVLMPWRSIGAFADAVPPDFRRKVEAPIAHYAAEIVTRAHSLLPMVDARTTPAIISSSDLAFMVRALPKVYLHVELSQETQDFPAEAWILFSHNANEFLGLAGLRALAELFKERLLSLLRIY